MLVEVLTRVTELERIDAKASGRRSRVGLILVRRARPMTTGRKNAVAAVLLITALKLAAATMTTSSSRPGFSPVRRRIHRPARSTTPVFKSAAVRISSARIMITVSLPKPAKASPAGTRPVRVTDRRTPSATTSAGMRSREKSTSAAAKMASRRPISGVTGAD